jgi:glycosyltransferase involved in cell wall biosynthesis
VNVLFYAGGFADVGGVEAFICDLSSALADHGHPVNVLCWGPDSDFLAAIARYGLVRRQRFRWGCRLSAPDLVLAASDGWRQVARHDLVVFTKIPPLPILRLLRRAGHRDRYRPFVYVTAYRPREMWRDRNLAGTLNLIDAIIVQAAEFTQDLRACGFRGIVETIPYIPPELAPAFELPDCRGALRLGFLGRLVPQKNLLYLLQAFSRLCAGADRSTAAARPWELHLFGDGDQRAALEQAAAAYGLQGRAFFHGAIPRESVRAAIDRCHLFAFSSVSEGQCLAALEILSRGRPVVATPVGAFPEILVAPELGAIAPLDDAQQFARILSEVGASLADGRLTPQATQTRFASLVSRDRIIQEYCSFLSGLTVGGRRLRPG